MNEFVVSFEVLKFFFCMGDVYFWFILCMEMDIVVVGVGVCFFFGEDGMC